MKIYQLEIGVKEKDPDFIVSSYRSTWQRRYEYFATREMAEERHKQLCAANDVIGLTGQLSLMVNEIDVKEATVREAGKDER